MVVTTYILFNHSWDLYSLVVGFIAALLIDTTIIYFKKRRHLPQKFTGLREEITKGNASLIKANKEISIAADSFQNLNKVLNAVEKNG